ncbi:MAG: hypothetical protein RR478_04120 [Bacilli bacterium]
MTPVLFIGVLKFYYIVIPGKEIGTVSDWTSFSGGYIGAVLALIGLWLQLHLEKASEKEKKNVF